jgi:hypothetical protein
MIQEAAPTGHGLAKWALALINPGSSGYYTVARDQMHDTPRFLADYSEWIRGQGSLHIGTHPPGLFLWARGSFDLMEARPDLARCVIAWAPESVDRAFRAVVGEGGLAVADRASLIVTGAATLIACAGTVVPLYLLARRRMNAAGAWAVASSWPLVPAALMFQPASDTAFPLPAVGAWLAISWSERAWGWAIVAGVIMAIGMQFSLVFLAVGAIAAVVIATEKEASLARRATRFVATGAGFLAMTVAAGVMMRANPFAIWWANQANHAQFYVDFPRSRLPWTLETPIEVAVAIGLAFAARAAAGLRLAPRETWAAAAVLLLLLITGRSLSEVARLWIPFFPLLLLAVGREFADGGSRSASLAWMLSLVGIQTIVLQTAIQVVYPVPV